MSTLPDGPIVRSRDRLWRVAPGFLTVSTIDGHITSAAGPAAEIWQRLADPVTLDELCVQLAAAHAIDAAQVRADIVPFISELIDRGHVEPAGAGEPR